MEKHDSEKKKILLEVEKNLKRLDTPGFAKFIPEVGSNLAYAAKGAKSYMDVAAVPGRIRNAMGRPVYMKPAFGASTHIASQILEAMKYDPGTRSSLNLRYSEEIISAAKSLGCMVVFVDRMKEPEEIQKIEGASVPWVLRTAHRQCGKVPDILYDRGSVGKEAITHILGRNPGEVVDIALKILKMLASSSDMK